MTTDVKLLPCPFCCAPAERIDFGPGDAENEGGSCIACTQCQSSGPVEFGRKEHFVSNWNHRAPNPLLAENERLRGEVERLTFEMGCLQQQYDERTAYVIVHRGAGLACSDAMRSAYSDEHHRAERLAEALRWIASDETAADVHSGMDEVDAIKGRARAALDQEGGNG